MGEACAAESDHNASPQESRSTEEEMTKALLKAAFDGDSQRVVSLLDKGTRPHSMDKHGSVSVSERD